MYEYHHHQLVTVPNYSHRWPHNIWHNKISPLLGTCILLCNVPDLPRFYHQMTKTKTTAQQVQYTSKSRPRKQWTKITDLVMIMA